MEWELWNKFAGYGRSAVHPVYLKVRGIEPHDELYHEKFHSIMQLSVLLICMQELENQELCITLIT